MLTACHATSGPPGQYQRELVGVMRVAVAQGRRKENHRIIEDASLAFSSSFQLAQKIRILLDVPAVDQMVLLQLVRVLRVVRNFMMGVRNAFQKSEVLRH